MEDWEIKMGARNTKRKTEVLKDNIKESNIFERENQKGIRNEEDENSRTT
jgi:hypothetical protein